MQMVQQVERSMADFEVSLETGQRLERRLQIRVPAQRIEREVQDRLRSVSRTANLKGYRPGKVPESVIRRRFGDQVRREVVQDVVQSTYNEALNRQQLRPVGDPQIDAGPEAGTDGVDLVYTASFEVFPEFTVQGLEELSVSQPEPAFDDADVEFVTENLRRQRAHWHASDRGAKSGDRVIVDFQGRMNGAPLEGGTGEKVSIVLGEGRMIADFESQLVGVRAGEKREIKVNFPADYPNAALAGQPAEFSIQVGEVAEEHLPEIDEEFIRSFGVESGVQEDFIRDVRKNMANEFAARSKAETKRQLLEMLLKANPIDIPVALVEQEATSLQADAMRNMGIGDATQAPSLESFRDTAERRVRLGLLVGAVIREQKIVVDRDKVRDRIDQLSGGYEKPDEIRKLYYQTAQLLTQVENSVLEEQVIDWLAAKAQIVPKPMPFRSLAGLLSANI